MHNIIKMKGSFCWFLCFGSLLLGLYSVLFNGIVPAEDLMYLHCVLAGNLGEHSLLHLMVWCLKAYLMSCSCVLHLSVWSNDSVITQDILIRDVSQSEARIVRLRFVLTLPESCCETEISTEETCLTITTVLTHYAL